MKSNIKYAVVLSGHYYSSKEESVVAVYTTKDNFVEGMVKFASDEGCVLFQDTTVTVTAEIDGGQSLIKEMETHILLANWLKYVMIISKFEEPYSEDMLQHFLRKTYFPEHE